MALLGSLPCVYVVFWIFEAINPDNAETRKIFGSGPEMSVYGRKGLGFILIQERALARVAEEERGQSPRPHYTILASTRITA